MNPSPARRLLLASVASLGLLAACGGSDDDSFDDRADIADPKLRFVHAVPGGPNVTLQRNGVNESGATDIDDLLEVIGAWGSCASEAPCLGTVNGDFDVDIDDLLAVISGWGNCL